MGGNQSKAKAKAKAKSTNSTTTNQEPETTRTQSVNSELTTTDFATKSDLDRYARKDLMNEQLNKYLLTSDLDAKLDAKLTTKLSNLSTFATKDELGTYVKRSEFNPSELSKFALKTEIPKCATNCADLKNYVTKDGYVEFNPEIYYTKTESNQRFATNSDLTDKLSKYVLSTDPRLSNLSTATNANFIKDSDLTDKLKNYVLTTDPRLSNSSNATNGNFIKDSDLTTKLNNYYTISDVDRKLNNLSTATNGNFVTNSDLTTKLGNYYTSQYIDNNFAKLNSTSNATSLPSNSANFLQYADNTSPKINLRDNTEFTIGDGNAETKNVQINGTLRIKKNQSNDPTLEQRSWDQIRFESDTKSPFFIQTFNDGNVRDTMRIGMKVSNADGSVDEFNRGPHVFLRLNKYRNTNQSDIWSRAPHLFWGGVRIGDDQKNFNLIMNSKNCLELQYTQDRGTTYKFVNEWCAPT